MGEINTVPLILYTSGKKEDFVSKKRILLSFSEYIKYRFEQKERGRFYELRGCNI